MSLGDPAWNGELTTPQQLFQTAIAHHRAGRLPAAERLYRQILQTQPGHADAIHLLGVIAHQVGKHDRAVAYIERAISLNPNAAPYYGNLGEALRRLGRLDDALAHYDKALAIEPRFADALSNRGAVLVEKRQFAAAEESCRQALATNSNHVDAWNNLGNALREQRKSAEAEQCYYQAATLNPNYPLAANNLGVLCQEQGRIEESREHFSRAIKLNPNYAEAHNGMGNVLKDEGHYDAAVESYRKAIALEPNRAEFHMNLSLVLLIVEQFAEGWQEYEWRRKTFLFRSRDYQQPEWKGESAPDGTLLLYAEQGFGDTIQFIRYAPLVRERVGRVVVECQPALMSLLRDCPGVDAWIAKGEPLPDFDSHCSLLSLPGIFQSTPENVPAEVPYLTPIAERVKYWQQRLVAVDGLKVGINWQGNRKFRADHSRSIPLATFAPLADVAGVQLYSIQYGHGREQLGDWPYQLPDLGGEFDDSLGAFVDSAAAMACLDLIITTDTAAAHLAGALGRPAWVVVPHSPDWRWLRERTDSPWYPTVKLFRPDVPRGWDKCVTDIRRELVDLAAANQ